MLEIHDDVMTFSVLLALCEGNPPVTGGFPSQSPVTWSFDVFFDLCLNKQLINQSRCRWFETPSCSLWRHCNAFLIRQKILHSRNYTSRSLYLVGLEHCKVVTAANSKLLLLLVRLLPLVKGRHLESQRSVSHIDACNHHGWVLTHWLLGDLTTVSN